MNSIRRSRGSSIAEFGPALIILFLVILFPLINLLYLGVAYASCWYLNYLEARELATNIPASSDGGTAATAALTREDTAWAGSALAAFVHANASSITPHTKGSNFFPSYDTSGGTTFVTITTGVTVQPFLTMPGNMINIPGITQPITFTMTDRREQEENNQN